MESDRNAWFQPFSDLNLQNKIVGNCVLDWSDDHTIAIATGCKLVVCNTKQLGKTPELDCGISALPLPECEEKSLEKLLDYENLTLQSSNILAYPDFEIYQLQLDPKFNVKKHSLNNGFKKVQFLYQPSVQKAILGATTLDQRFLLYRPESSNLHGKWELVVDLSNNLRLLFDADSDRLRDTLKLSDVTELEKVYSSAISNFAWSSVFCDERGQSFVYLTAITDNGLITIWKLSLPLKTEEDLLMLHISDLGYGKVCDLACHKQSAKDSSKLLVVLSNYEGLVVCKEFSVSSDSELVNTGSNELWKDADNLASKNLQWISVENTDTSLIVGTKACHLIAWKLNEKLEILQEFTESIDSSSILSVVFCKADPNVFYLCNDDGSVMQYNVEYSPSLNIAANQSINPSDDACYRNFSPVSYHAISLSPNGAFLALVKSYPKVCRSVQIDNTAFLSMRRLMNVEQAARMLLSASTCGEGEIFKQFDVFEIVRQHYFMEKEFCPPIKRFLESPASKCDSGGKLCLRWYLLKAQQQLQLQLNEKSTNGSKTEELSLVESIIISRQMIKVIQCWINTDDGFSQQSSQIVPIINWLQSHNSLLMEEYCSVINEAKRMPRYASLPKNLTCYYTSQPVAISHDAKEGVTPDGSRWPMCSLTFTPLQKPSKRVCHLSGLFADCVVGSNWSNSLLKSPCIFSHVPFT